MAALYQTRYIFWLMLVLSNVETGLGTEKAAPFHLKLEYDYGPDSVELKIEKPKTIVLRANSTVRLIVTEAEATADFYIFEAHSLEDDIFFEKPSIKTTIENIYWEGHSMNTTSPAVYSTHPQSTLKNFQSKDLSVIVFVRAYQTTSPIPGRCNTNLGTPKPYIQLSLTGTIAQLNFYQAGSIEYSCQHIQSFQYKVYEYFLPENDCSFASFQFGYNTFFNDSTRHGHLVTTLTNHQTRVNFTNYPRTGRIIAVVVHNGTNVATYGMAHTYGIHLNNGCQIHNSIYIGLSCAIGVFVGMGLTFLGHRFFKFSQFVYGFYLGSLLGYLLFNSTTHLESSELMLLTTMSGLLMACCSLAVWCLLGIPVLAVLLPTLEIGFFIASTTMYLPPLCRMSVFADDSTYWLVFICITLSPTILLVAFTQKASIISSVVLGTMTVILSVDQFTGSNLKFIVGNVFNRVFVNGFGQSYRCPPLQNTDLLLFTCMLGLIALGLVCQLIVERKKAPFPPGPFQQWRWARQQQQDELTPLITSDVVDISSDEPPHVVGYIHAHSIGSATKYDRVYRGSKAKQIQTGSLVTGSTQQRRDIFSPCASST